ncbi:phosphotyrosine protein [Wolfiporia cocos MD-104 SS10]|uniref:phosphatidylinositol-3,4,5-trisphosphate 3-phosphatase n=1 Tax=Wolfiporia cocos (strain MD-104) TaxID=742152 RepID=A0A2H3K8Y6_WOLCO|nr:phosphotyrosine protein [Wolfiporia cocos MD-104 SS10]
MSDFVRRLVSGDKARFRDGELQVDLDLVYIINQVIVMGYPSAGLEALYRNSREDAKRFLQHRHGEDFWVFNFCPVKENSYPSSVFDGRVSRYPFPDHHTPPLAILPLVVREMRVWLEKSSEHVAVLHCKAGKGRSGTMACAYLLALESTPTLPSTNRSPTARERVASQAERVMDAMPSDDTCSSTEISSEGSADVALDQRYPKQSGETKSRLSQVLELHTSRRMKRSSSPSKTKQGVSIPSQRRWLYYWSLLLARQGPPRFWASDPSTAEKPVPNARLTRIAVRMRELSGVKTHLLRAANAVIERTGYAKATVGNTANVDDRDQVWASLARYDDELVYLLERWERNTRDGDNMGRRKAGSDRIGEEALVDIFKDDRWDRSKMVRSFARFGMEDNPILTETSEAHGKITTRALRPLSDHKWVASCEKIQQNLEKRQPSCPNVDSEETSPNDATHAARENDGLILNANREVRVKLYMGQVFMAWFWFIPAFHMPHSRSNTEPMARLTLNREELDFPIGIGSHIVDVQLSLEWVPEATDHLDPPTRQGSPTSREGHGEPAGIAALVHAASTDRLSDMVHTKQAAED